jgi:hypothetical protein
MTRSSLVSKGRVALESASEGISMTTATARTVLAAGARAFGEQTVDRHARGSLPLLRNQVCDGVHALLSRFLHVRQRFLGARACQMAHPT